MSRPCVCGGSNENCRYCSGRGEIGDRLAGALVTHSKHPSKLSGGRKTKAEKTMETASEIRTIERRLSRFQRLRFLVFGTPVASGNKVPRLVPCPMGCGAQLDPRKVNRHLHAKHKPTTKARQRIAADSVSGQEWQSCTVCKARVKTRRLQRHLKKVHRKADGNKHAAYKSRGTPKVESVKDVLRDNTTLAAPRDKNLDATKLYAHSYREQGRFGSHPSHDGFDDESGPE